MSESFCLPPQKTAINLFPLSPLAIKTDVRFGRGADIPITLLCELAGSRSQ